MRRGGRIGWWAACALCLLCVLPGRALDANTEFLKGLVAYDERDFQQAIDLYLGILDAGHEAPELHVNLGHAYFKLGQTGRAVLHYRRAGRTMSTDPDLRSNLEMALSSTGATAPVDNPVVRFLRGFPHNGWMALAVASFWLPLLIFCGFCFLRPGLGWWVRIGTAGALGLGLGLVGGHFTAPANYPDEVVVVGSPVEVRLAPLPEAEVQFSLPPGSVAVAMREQDGRLEIRSGRQRGWVPADGVESVR